MGEDLWVTAMRFEQQGDARGLAELLVDPRLAKRRRLRRNVLCRLARVEDPVASATLVQAFRFDEDEGLRLLAALLLARRGGDDVEPVLIEALRSADAFRVRVQAAEGLESSTSKDAATVLVAALEDPHGTVRWQAAKSLGWIGISRPEVIGPLTEALDDRHRQVRLNASRSLARIGARSALPAMRRARDRSWPPWRWMIAKDVEQLEESVIS